MSRQPSAFLLALLLLVLLVVSSKPAFGQQGETLTLEQAITTALRNNRQLKIKELDVGKSEDELAGGRTLRLPKFNIYSLASQQLTQIDFTFKQGVFGTFPGIGPVPDKDTNIFYCAKANRFNHCSDTRAAFTTLSNRA